MHEAIQRFIEGCRDAFPRGPGVIAACYAEPCVTVRGGVARVNATREDTERLFAEVDRKYHADGFTRGDIVAMDVRLLGATSALATVRWADKGSRGETLREATFSYNPHRGGRLEDPGADDARRVMRRRPGRPDRP